MGRLLQIIGCVLMLAAIGGALGLGGPADAEIMAPVEQAFATLQSAVAQAIASPTPAPSPSGVVLPNATPTPAPYHTVRGGPFRFSLNGSLALGSRVSEQSLTGGNLIVPSATPSGSPSPFLGAGGATTAQNEATEALGLFAEATRRTATTSTDIKVPISFASGGDGQGIIGQSQVIYSTPKYALGYGPEAATAFSQLPVGSTLRSVYAIVPSHNGDMTFFNGPTLGALGEQIPLSGVLWRESRGSQVYEGGLDVADGLITGQSETAIFGAATSKGALTAIGEGAYQDRTGGDMDESGLSYQVRADDGSNNSYLTGVYRRVDNGFVSFDEGEIYGDNYLGLNYHRSGTLQSLTLNASSETTGSLGGSELLSQVAGLNYSGPWHLGTYTLNLQAQKDASGDVVTSVDEATTQLSAALGPAGLQLSNLLERTLGETDQLQTGYTTLLQLPIRSIVAGLSFDTLRLDSTVASGSSLNITEGVSISHTFGRTAISLSDLFEHTTSTTSDALMRNLQTTVSRAISPAISVQVQYGLQSLNDRLNPAANGRSSNFAINLNAPFSYGNGVVSGRVDPRLPATIVGRVLTSSSGNPTLAGLASGGMANAVVILDNKTSQRTDVSGNFQFSFVAPGQHQLRIDNGSLPRGVTVDIPVDTLQVGGGQTLQVTFVVGNFGGINGHVYGRDDTGAIVPLPNVLLRIDGAQYSQTDASGAYGFGRLQPGKHTVSIVESSVPAFATFDSAQDKATINVQNGQYATLDFTAQPLGSIEGSVVFGKDMGADASTGVLNAYVVAEPGEHAAIVNEDGSYVIDDLAPGDYTVSVDPETVPEGLGTAPDSVAITLQSKEHYQGAVFTVGHTEKKVTFSFLGGGGSTSAPSAPKTHLSESRLPPHGYATVTVDAPQDAGSVTLEAFGQQTALSYDAKAALWRGALSVPTNVKAGSYSIETKVANGTQPQAATLVVDANMPIAIMQTDPANPQLGQYVHVRARFLVDARAGDRIDWADGQMTTLGLPFSGRVFTFNLRVSLRPLHGVLLTKGARLPISLM
jgi:hypothetical protein